MGIIGGGLIGIMGGVAIGLWIVVIRLRYLLESIGGGETTEVNNCNLFCNALTILLLAMESPSVSPRHSSSV